MTRAILARSSSVLASRSMSEAIVRMPYGLWKNRSPLATMSSWLATRSICTIMRSMTWASLSPFDTWYVSGNSRPSSEVTPGGRRLASTAGSAAAARKSAAVIVAMSRSTRAAIWLTVNPSGNVTLVYVCPGGVRRRPSTLPMWSLVPSS